MISFRFLGINIKRERENKTIYLNQHDFIEELLNITNMNKSHGAKTPLCSDYNPFQESTPLNQMEKKDATINGISFRTILGKLAWLSTKTRPDLTYTVNLLSRFGTNPCKVHLFYRLRLGRRPFGQKIHRRYYYQVGIIRYSLVNKETNKCFYIFMRSRIRSTSKSRKRMFVSYLKTMNR